MTESMAVDLAILAGMILVAGAVFVIVRSRMAKTEMHEDAPKVPRKPKVPREEP